MNSRPARVGLAAVAVVLLLLVLAFLGRHAYFLVGAAFVGIGYLVGIGIAAFVAGWAFRKGWDLAGRP